jgi:hypothetical protein
MLGGNCCCGCTIFNDTFPPTIPSGDWTVISGTWVTNFYLKSNNVSSHIVSTNDHPDSEAENILTGSILGGPGDIAFIIISYKDEDNMFYAVVEFNDSSTQCGYISLRQKVAGVDTQLAIQIPAGPLPNQQTTYQVCFSAEEKTFTAKVGTVNVSHTFDTVPFTDGYKIGYGVGSVAANVRFYNTTWNKHKSTTNPDCVNCSEVSNPTACKILETWFNNYPVGTDPGCLFNVVTGVWEIQNVENPSDSTGYNERNLVCKSDGGLLQCIMPEPTGSQRQMLKVKFAIKNTDIEAGAFINYNQSNGNRYLATAELYGDDTVNFRLYNNGTLIDYDILPIINLRAVSPDPFSDQIIVEMCLDLDGDGVLQVTYQAWDILNPSVYGTLKHTMWDFAAGGNTGGYYAGMEVVDNNQAGITNVPYYYFYFSRHIDSDSNCPECDYGCAITIQGPTFAVPCYLKLDVANFKEMFTDCTYGHTQACSDLIGIYYATWLGNYWETADFNNILCNPTSQTIVLYFQSMLYYDYNMLTDQNEWHFITYLYARYLYYGPFGYHMWEKWYGQTPPNIFNWINEDIPSMHIYNPALISGLCADHSDPPTLKVSYADLDVP